MSPSGQLKAVRQDRKRDIKGESFSEEGGDYQGGWRHCVRGCREQQVTPS